MVEFKQFYTQQEVSQLLISLLEHDYPVSCLELSAGEGALLDSALVKFPHLNITAFDIDPKNADFLSSKYPSANIYCIDSTSQDLAGILKEDTFDIALCNPPFHFIDNNPQFQLILEEVFGQTIKSKRIRAEVVFMAINLLYLKDGGELIIVLPDLFYSSDYYIWLRTLLTKKFTIKNIIECEHRSFLKTEAKTHVFHIIKSSEQQGEISFFKYGDGIAFHKGNICLNPSRVERKRVSNLNNSDYSIFRGRLSGKECKASGYSYFHTNSFNSITYKSRDIIPDGNFVARNGDVLIARVGSRVIGKYEVFKGEKAIVSDCIFCIQFKNNEFKLYFLDFWEKNKDGWLQENMKGTCAKHISLASVHNLLEQLFVTFML